ncbi:MAG: hypothetical protein EA365_01710 [Gloeocapsa sp. DLM2.Bin57]|nr:MAG: hypothetical protein EA365_01710 [Gloeocapsa sp. DLM2.Bin57]
MNNQEQSFLTPEESAAVDMALLSSEEKFLTRLTVSSLRLLKLIATDLDVAIADLTHTQIIAWFEKEALIKREQGLDGTKLKW